MLPYNVTPVLDRFLRAVTAYEEIGVMTDHKLNTSKRSDYKFGGVIVPTTDTELQLLPEGEVKSGAMTVYVRAPRKLYMNDVQNEKSISRQSYIKEDGMIYKVKVESPRFGDGLYRKYICTRWVPGT